MLYKDSPACCQEAVAGGSFLTVVIDAEVDPTDCQESIAIAEGPFVTDSSSSSLEEFSIRVLMQGSNKLKE